MPDLRGNSALPKKRSSFAGAFTTTELVVVILIAALLVGLLLPTITVARRRMAITQCASNLRQIGQVMRLYLLDNRGAIPSVNVMPAPFNNPKMPNAAIYDAFDPYLPRSSDVYRRPCDSGQIFDRCAAGSAQHFGVSYVYVPIPERNPYSLESGMMWDYLGDSLHGIFASPAHGKSYANTLFWDGSVNYGGYKGP